MLFSIALQTVDKRPGRVNKPAVTERNWQGICRSSDDLVWARTLAARIVRSRGTR
jgi:hypothetical protein